MRVRVLFFGMLKEICGKAEDQLDLPAQSTLRNVFENYASAYPKLRAMASSIVLARNHTFAPPEEMVQENDEIALLPPVSGGSFPLPVSDPQGNYFALTRSAIPVNEVETRILQGIDGAIVTFQGVVRNNTRGRATLRLEYECYEEMAIRMMVSIGQEIASAFAISRIAMVHRLGSMEIGEASVVIVAAAPHRKPAFDAALEGINRLKRTVPVWKKEFFADGEVWVEGEWDDKTPRAGL